MYAQKYESIISACRLGAWEFNVKTGDLWCNKMFFDMLGRATNATLGWDKYSLEEGWLSLIHPDDLNRANQYFADYLQNPTGVYQQVLRLQHKDGGWRWIWCRGKAIENPADQNPFGLIVGSHVDITDQKEAETYLEKLRISALEDNAVLNSIFNSPRDVEILAINQRYEYIMFTQNHKQLVKEKLGIDIEKGTNLLSILPPNFSPKIKKHIDKAFTGQYLQFDIENILPNGEIIYTTNTYSPIYDAHNEVTGVTLFIRDITKEKLVEINKRENELRYISLFNGSTDAIFIADANSGMIVDANKSATKLIGIPRDQLIGKHQSQLHPAEEFEIIVEKFKYFSIHDDLKTTECNLQHRNGKKILVRITASNRFHVGRNTYVAGYFKDISAEKVTNERINKITSLLNQAELIASIGSIEIDVKTNERFWSDGFYKILGYEPRSIKPSMDLFVNMLHPDDRKAYLDWFNKNIFNNEKNNSIFTRVIRKDGSVRNFFATGIGIFDPTTGKLTQIIVVIQDITEKIQLQEKLISNHLQLKKLTQQIPVAIVQLDTDDDRNPYFSFISEGVKNIDQYLTSEMILQNPDLLFKQMTQEDRERIPTLFKTSATSQNNIYTEILVTKTNGKKGWIKLAYYPEKKPNGKTTWYGYMEDITEQKKINEAIELQNKQLREVAWIQSHVVRAPLSRLMGLVNAIKCNVIDKDELDEFLGYVVDSAKELDEIIHDIVSKVNKIELEN